MLKQKPLNMNAQRSINIIVETLIDLLKEKKFSAISISELTKKAGLVRNTFYAHFENKEDVLSYYMYQIFRRRISEALGDRDIHGLVFELLYFEIWAEHTDLLEIFKSNDLLYLLSQFGERFNLICEEFDIFGACQVSDLSKPYVDMFYADALASIVKRWMQTGQKENPEELVKIFKEFIR